MEQFDVRGMSCAACAARIEKAVSKVEGVDSCAVSLLTNSMGVDGSADSKAIIDAVEKAGYSASLKGYSKSENQAENMEKVLEDKETPLLKKRLIVSLGFLLVLMYFSMGHTMFKWPVPAWFEDNFVAIALVQMLLAVIVMVINQKFFINGYKSLFLGAPNMDTLVALGSSAAFIYSTYTLFEMTDALKTGNTALAMAGLHNLYFESSAMILTLITVGKMLESMSKGRTTDALKDLMKLGVKKANLLIDGTELSVPVEQVKPGDIFVVRPGESFPVDGIILEGNTAVNESAITGESIPADKTVGDAVITATVNQSGFVKCQATRVGEDTTLSQIIKLVSDAAATKAPIARIANKVSGVFVPAVIGIAVITIIIWVIAGASPGYALIRGISVLVISCPCALGLATPVAIMVGSGIGAKNGILFKTSASLEEAGKINIVALDKTGTITKGEPVVTDMIPAEGISENELLGMAYALEKKSEHPLAKAIVREAEKNNLKDRKYEITDFISYPGKGLEAKLSEQELLLGNYNYVNTRVEIDENLKKISENLANAGKTTMFVSKAGKVLGVIGVADVIKNDSQSAIAELKNMGIKVVMITGDNEKTAGAIGNQAGVDCVIAGVLPDGKEKAIRELQTYGNVAMVGDGINDAPALTRANLGIAIGAGTDVAIDAADIVLMKSTLKDVAAAVRLSRKTLKNIKENLFWAFIYNIIGIPLAAGLYIHLLGWELSPMFGAAAMSMSSFCVVSNALRLNFFKLYDTTKDKKTRKSINEINIKFGQERSQNMTKTLKIEGMMCGHCEAAVKKALEAIEQVEEAKVSHEAGEAVVSLGADVDDSVLIKAVEDKDYKVLSVE